MKQIITVLLELLFLSTGIAQNTQFFIQEKLNNDEGHQLPKYLYKIDVNTGKEKVLFQTQKSGISKSCISPNSKYISLIETEWLKNAPGHNETQLIIIDTTGNVISTISQVRAYTWNPDGNKIAYITGKYGPGGLEGIGFNPDDNVNIIEVNNQQQKDVIQSHQPYGLNWLSIDNQNRLYIMGRAHNAYRKIVYYDSNKKQTIKANVMGINFSPDGKYYYMYPYETQNLTLCKHNPLEESRCLHVYETQSNKLKTQISSKYAVHQSTVKWIYDENHLLLISEYAKPLHKKKLINVETNQIIQEVSGELLNIRSEEGGSYILPTNKDHWIIRRPGNNYIKEKIEIIKLQKNITDK